MDEREASQSTVDLAALARIRRGDRVAVRPGPNTTGELFEETLALVDAAAGRAAPGPDAPARAPREAGYLPEHPDLRTLYRLAEAVGGYEALHELISEHSPGSALSRRYREKARRAALGPDEVRRLREYREGIERALASAHRFLRESAVHTFDRDELRQLHDVMLAASDRTAEIDRILGEHFVHEIERVVERLAEIRGQMQQVEHTVDGLFLVDNAVMFVPGRELVEIVNLLFEAVGNPHLARHVDGVLLLAARNLLIEVVAFYSYYGKHQIYNVIRRAGAGAGTRLVTARIRHEIRGLFEACKRDNRLVLTRIMESAEREFEVSVEAIQTEAEDQAVRVVRRFMAPEAPPAPPPRRRGLLSRLLAWLGGGR